jgi:pyrroline-5-carboxylate reductase
MKYAFLGAGKMASAIIQGMLRAKVCEASEIIVACPEPGLLQSLHEATGVKGVSSNAEATQIAPVIILCVKPQDAASALEQTNGNLKGKLLLSIAAGLTIKSLQKMAPGARVIRAMPNTAAIVGQSATAFSCDSQSTPADRSAAETVFSSIGASFPVEEKKLDAVTGLSGSGPAYVFLVMEALSDGGVACGLPRKLAQDLAIQTVLGAAQLARETGEHPAILREMVTSPAGTTAAALKELENRGARAAFIEAVRAAESRSKELSAE